MPLAVAVLDANVLVPIVACDFFLTAFEHHLFEPIVSSTVLDEVERTLIEDFPQLDPGALRRRVEHMRAALDDQTVDTQVVEGLPDMINAKDRHVIAAALVAQATIVVTNDNALRSEIAGSGLDLESGRVRSAKPSSWRTSSAAMSCEVLVLQHGEHLGR